MTELEVEIVDNPDRRRFEAWLDGKMAGSAYYRRRNSRVIFTHTEVDDIYESRGIGSQLAQAALDAVRSSGDKAVPLCPFIDSYIQRHGEYADLVDEEMTESLRR